MREEIKLKPISDNIIKPISEQDLPFCLEVIRNSFATVATDFRLTEQNCPNHTSFMKIDKLNYHFFNGFYMFGYFNENKIIGYVSLSKTENIGVYELHNLSVLPEFRHLGCGKKLIDFCKNTVKSLEGNKIIIGITEENIVLKNWYLQNGFIHKGTKIFEHLPFTVGFMEWEI